ncbi:cyanophycin synthetase [Arenibaculum pallidiluteum]|uniref:cyanophycin synthetase n=1 Tax=Arenibaculum pallidiluteum TaxID=2812559 RepID=UPI001A95EA9E|nr:cyanophycin synthetase [Arenibaculum pallidiluteum]
MTEGAASKEGIRVIASKVYRGPNLFGDIPMVHIQVDLRALEAWPTDRLPGFSDSLLALLPGLRRHGCSYQEPGGFVRRLEEGTWLGHVAEHVALELQTSAGSPATRGKTRSVKGRPGVYDILFQYREAKVGLLAGRLALQLVDSLLPEDLHGVEGLDLAYRDDQEPVLSGAFDLSAALDLLRRMNRKVAFGPTTGAIVAEAVRRGIPVLRLDDLSLVQLGHGRQQQRLRASISGMTSYIATETASDKNLTKLILTEAGVPVPKGVVVRGAEEAAVQAARLGHPVVTKPLDGNHGRGVSLGLVTADEVRWGYEQAARHGRRVIVEQHFQGRDYRVLVVGGEVVAVAERVPAHVVGDGAGTVAALIEEVNRDPRRGEGHESVMTRITVDDHVLALLERAGLGLDSVPEAGQVVWLRDTANLSTGGTAIDRTDEIHPENAVIARRAAQAIGLDIAGIDLIAPDIARSVRDTGGGVVEVNAAPGFRMHLEPSAGRPRNVARPVVEMMFPRGTAGRIPIFAITGTNGKSTTVRMLAHILRHHGLCVGFTTTTGVYVDGERIADWDASGPRSARMVLRDPTVDAAVLETARGGILREGLGFDRCDVGAVLNVEEDHLGLKGVETIEDLAWVKSVVVEAVHRDGHSVLNADDPLTARMARRAGGRTVYFSMRGGDDMPELLRRHVGRGGLAVLREHGARGGEIVIHEDGERLSLMCAAEIPATFGGLAEFNIQNALAAVAMAHAHGVPLKTIRGALAAFSTSFEQSPGRLNVYDGHGFRVLLDYAHNPAGMRALGGLVKGLRSQHRRVIGMVNIPGDRRDDDIRQMGEIAAGIFDEIVFREDPARRGRKPGEIVDLLAEGAFWAGFPRERTHCILDEQQAANVCLSLAQPGDLVVLTPTEVEDMWKQVLTFDPARAVRPGEDGQHDDRNRLRGVA